MASLHDFTKIEKCLTVINFYLIIYIENFFTCNLHVKNKCVYWTSTRNKPVY